MAIKWLIAYSVILAVAGKLWFFTYNDYFALVNLPLPWYGIIFFALNIVAAIFSHRADWLESHLGERGSLVLLPVFIFSPLILMGIWVAVPCAFLVLSQNVVRGYQEPFMANFYHRHIDSKRRATLCSIRSASIALVSVVSLFLFGSFLKIVSLPTALIVLGLVVAFSSGLLLTSYNHVFKTKKRVSN